MLFTFYFSYVFFMHVRERRKTESTNALSVVRVVAQLLPVVTQLLLQAGVHTLPTIQLYSSC